MRFVRLTLLGSGNDVFVNPEMVTFFHPGPLSGSRICFANGEEEIQVKETVEQVVEFLLTIPDEDGIV